jgi:hypothetical protein
VLSRDNYHTKWAKIIEKHKSEIKRLESEMYTEIELGLLGKGDINKFHVLKQQWKELMDLEFWRLKRRIGVRK